MKKDKKYEITFNGNNNNEDSVIVEADHIELIGGHLCMNFKGETCAIFSNWLRVLKVQE